MYVILKEQNYNPLKYPPYEYVFGFQNTENQTRFVLYSTKVLPLDSNQAIELPVFLEFLKDHLKSVQHLEQY